MTKLFQYAFTDNLSRRPYSLPSSTGFSEFHLVFVELYMCSNQLFNEVSLMTVMLCSDIREYQNIIWNKFMDTFFSDYVLFYPLSLTYPDSGPCPQAVSDLGTLSWYGS